MLMRWWQQLRNYFGNLARKLRRANRYRVGFFEARNEAQSAARAPNLLAIFHTGGKPKWAYLLCPCGCSRQIALNLMPSQRPVWCVSIRTETDFSIFPSVDSTTCGAHFWLRSGRITWAE